MQDTDRGGIVIVETANEDHATIGLDNGWRRKEGRLRNRCDDPGQPDAEPFGNIPGFGRGRLGQQDREFLAAEPADDVVVAQQAAHRGGDPGQHRVPGQVAGAVVDRLEVVDIDHCDGQRGAGPDRAIRRSRARRT